MHSITPAPADIHLDADRRVRLLPSPGSGATIHGPDWITHVARGLAGWASWPGLDYRGVSQSPPAPPDGESTVPIIVQGPENGNLQPSSIPDSSYAMSIDPGRVAITVGEPAGLVQALRALGRLADEDGSVPAGTIEDRPAFAWRGIHLDVCRHFFSVDFIKRLLRLQASLGFNIFHWHLTEDQGWRIPVDDYPRLTEVGAWRTQADGSRYGGFYTPEEISEVVRYAGKLGILVMPEIELPGHATAALAAYPELSCRRQPLSVSSNWGIHDDVFCAGNDRVFDLLGSVFNTVTSLFPSQFVHLGGDECPKTRWEACPRCNTRMRQEHLDDLDQLQSYVISRAARMLAERGRTAIGWDEILEGGLPEDTIVMSWRGTAGGTAAAQAGHQVIMTPTSHCYFDFRQIDSPEAVGFAFPDGEGNIPVLPVDKVYEFEPTKGLSGETASHVLGGQANVWTEQLPNEETAERMIAPRIIAMAEALWTAPLQRDFATFRPRLRAALEQLDAQGWRYERVPELA